MAYSNAVFYIDYANGSDTARATLTGVVLSNPSGNLVMGTYAGHGLVTGACVTLSAFGAANGTYKITRINDDTFYLDDTTWAQVSHADVTGNAVPFGGSSWADAWATIPQGASSTRIQAGDVIRIAKTPDPVSIGQNATWTGTAIAGGGDKASKNIVSTTDATPIVVRATGHGLVTGDVVFIANHTTNYNANGAWIVTRVDNDYFSLDGSIGTGAGAGGAAGAIYPYNSQAVILANAVTKMIDDCEGGWAASGSSTVSNAQTGKSGKAVKVSKSSPSNNTLYAYKTIPETDYSAYSAITLWLYTSTSIAANTTWKICLCSDTAGATIVDEFLITPTTPVNSWTPRVLAKNGGGSLGASIKSVALYSGSSAATTAGITMDNINATTAGGFGVGDLISKNSLAVGGDEGFHGLQGIYDKVLITAGFRGYAGTTETVALYYRKTQEVLATGNIQQSGTEGNLIQFLGGWNTSTTVQDGETYLDGHGKNIDIIDQNNKTFFKIDRISAIRGTYGYDLGNAGTVEIGSINDIYGCTSGFQSQTTTILIADAIRRVNGCTIGMTFYSNSLDIGSIGQVNGGQNGIRMLANIGKAKCLLGSIGDASNHSQYGIQFTNNYQGTIIGSIGRVAYCGLTGLYFNAAKCVVIEAIDEVSYNTPFGIYFNNACAYNEIGEVADCSNNSTYGLSCQASVARNYIGEITTANNGTGGIRNEGIELLIGKATCGEESKVSIGTTNWSIVGIAEWGGTSGRFYRVITNGIISDQITGGQDAAWAYGATGLCLYYNPTSASDPLYDEFFIPCTAAQGMQIHFQVKKTSAAANCTMKVSVSGCGITPLRRSEVTLSDSWAEYTSDTLTPTETGFLKVSLEVQDGATTGDIGIDDIHFLEV